MSTESLSNNPELRARFEACQTPEEVLALAKKEGIKLNDDQLESIVGGSAWSGSTEYYKTCGHCGEKYQVDPDNIPSRCPNCAVNW